MGTKTTAKKSPAKKAAKKTAKRVAPRKAADSSAKPGRTPKDWTEPKAILPTLNKISKGNVARKSLGMNRYTFTKALLDTGFAELIKPAKVEGKKGSRKLFWKLTKKGADFRRRHTAGSASKPASTTAARPAAASASAPKETATA